MWVQHAPSIHHNHTIWKGDEPEDEKDGLLWRVLPRRFKKKKGGKGDELSRSPSPENFMSSSSSSSSSSSAMRNIPSWQQLASMNSYELFAQQNSSPSISNNNNVNNNTNTNINNNYTDFSNGRILHIYPSFHLSLSFSFLMFLFLSLSFRLPPSRYLVVMKWE